MTYDRLVTPEHVLNGVMEHERRGSRMLIRELEKLEPGLMEYLLEGLTRVYHRLTDLGLTGRDARKALCLAEKTAPVCIVALRNAHRDLWESGPGRVLWVLMFGVLLLAPRGGQAAIRGPATTRATATRPIDLAPEITAATRLLAAGDKSRAPTLEAPLQS